MDLKLPLVALKPIILQYRESANLARQFGKSISDFEAKRFQAYVKATFRFPAIYITGKEASGATSGTAEGHLSWIHKITSSWASSRRQQLEHSNDKTTEVQNHIYLRYMP